MTRSGVDQHVEHDPEPPPALEGHARRTRYVLVFIPMHMRGMIWSERTNAAFGLGFVDPWSDRRLTEYVLSIPQAVINRPGELRKRLARAAMRGIMPEELRQNAAKIVPSPLFHQALRRTGVDTIRTLLTDMEAERRGYLNGDALRAHYETVVAGRGAHPTLWWALTLEMWLRRYWA
jgi:asparagine synthase (glutamine-hydrolysing)